MVEDGNTSLLTGIVNGNSVYSEIEETRLDNNTECRFVEHIVGIIKGNRITGYHTGAETCGTCRSHGKFIVKIVK